MSFRHDKVRGNHPITPKKGIKESDFKIKGRGNKDTINVLLKASRNKKNLATERICPICKASFPWGSKGVEDFLNHLMKQHGYTEAQAVKIKETMYGHNYEGVKPTTEEQFAQYWDIDNEWREDDLYDILSGKYKNEETYDNKVDEYHEMKYKELPEFVKKEIRKKYFGVQTWDDYDR